MEQQQAENEKLARQLADEMARERRQPEEPPSKELKEALEILKSRKRDHRATLDWGRRRVIEFWPFK